MTCYFSLGYCCWWIFYLLKLKIVICFQAKKHHHINCWIKSSLDYHELFSLYTGDGNILLQYESITDYFRGPVQANIINWILCEKNGILQIIFANPINDWWNISLYPLYTLLQTLLQSSSALFILFGKLSGHINAKLRLASNVGYPLKTILFSG